MLVNSTLMFKLLFTAHNELWKIKTLKFMRPHVAIPTQDGNAPALRTYECGALTNRVNASTTAAYTHTSHGVPSL